MNLSLISAALRALASVAPIVIREGHGERVTQALNTVATLTDRGAEAAPELHALTEKLKAMNGVDREEKERLWAQLEDTSARIAEAAKKIPGGAPPPADPTPPPAGDPPASAPEGGDGSGDAGGSGTSEPQ